MMAGVNIKQLMSITGSKIIRVISNPLGFVAQRFEMQSAPN